MLNFYFFQISLRFLATLLLFFLLLDESAHAFAPRTFKVFSHNLKRLVNDGEYQYAQQYFLKYHETFATNQNYSAMALNFVQDMPIVSNKEALLKTYLNESKQGKHQTTARFKDIYLKEFRTLYGKIALQQGKFQTAYEQFSRAQNYSDNLYYLGSVAFFLNKPKEATKHLKKFVLLRENSATKQTNVAQANSALLVQKAYLMLSEINYRQKFYEHALQYANKSNLRSVDKTILLYHLYKAMNKQVKKDFILNFIQKNYKHTLKGKQFLNAIKIKKRSSNKQSRR